MDCYYQYNVRVCDKSHPESFFVTIASFGGNEKEKVNALVDLLCKRSKLDPDAVLVTYDPVYCINIADDSPLCKPVDDFHAKRNAAFEAKKVK